MRAARLAVGHGCPARMASPAPPAWASPAPNGASCAYSKTRSTSGRVLCGLDRLYELVRANQEAAPAGGLSPAQVAEICNVIEGIPLQELGLEPSLGQAIPFGTAGTAREQRARLRSRGSRGTVTYLDIHDDPTMTIGIFQLPPGARMPLHDHPGMTVFSRLLYGTLHVRAYDWLDSGSDRQAAAGAAGADSSSSNSSSSSGGGGNNSMDSAADGDCAGGGSGSSSTCTGEPSLMGISGPVSPARLVTDRVLTAPADTMVLFPSAGGNIHAFTAISPCAILDVLTPPYGDRNCTYYREVFPPQWLDAAGQPALVPSEEVAAWVAWQQASDDTGELHVSEQQQQQQSGQGGRFGVAGRDDIMVGLEVWREPADFHVTRGTYTGQRLTLAGSGSSGQPP